MEVNHSGLQPRKKESGQGLTARGRSAINRRALDGAGSIRLQAISFGGIFKLSDQSPYRLMIGYGYIQSYEDNG